MYMSSMGGLLVRYWQWAPEPWFCDTVATKQRVPIRRVMTLSLRYIVCDDVMHITLPRSNTRVSFAGAFLRSRSFGPLKQIQPLFTGD